MYGEEQSGIRWARLVSSSRALLAVCLGLIVLIVVTPSLRAQDEEAPRQGKGAEVSVARFESDKDHVALPTASGRGLLLTEALTINGKSVGYMVVDTGSDITVLDTKRSQKLGLKLLGDLSLNGRAGGHSYMVDTVAIGPLLVRHKVVASLDLTALQVFQKPVVGIIGCDLLGKVPFSIDYATPALTLHNPARFVPPKDVPAFDLLPGDARPMVEGTLGRKRVTFLLNTGYSGSVHVPPAMAAVNPKAMGPAIHPLRVTKSLGVAKAAQYRFRVDEMTILGRTWRNVRNVSTTGMSTVSQAEGRKEHVNVGAQLLRHYRLTFDYRQRKVWASTALSVEDRLKAGQIKLASQNFAGFSPLAEAAVDGEQDAFAALLKAGAPVDFVDDQRERLLHLAVKGGDARIVSAILAHNRHPDVNHRTRDGFTALMLTAVFNEPGMAKQIAEAGADLNLQTRLGDTALSYAVDAEFPEVVKLLLAKGAKVGLTLFSGTTPVATAAAKGNEEIFNMLVKAGASLDMNNRDARALVHFAAFGGNPVILKHILELKPKIPVDGKDRHGLTPLMVAARAGRAQAVETLLKKGADPGVVTPLGGGMGGETALHQAATGGSEETIRILLAHGLAVDARTTGSVTPLMLAVGWGHLRAVDGLLHAGADVNATDKSNVTALHYAVKRRQASVLPILLRAGAKVNAVTNRRVRPLDMAAILGDVDAARILVKAGADPKARGPHRRSAIDFAREAGHARLADLLQNGFRGVPKPAVPRK